MTNKKEQAIESFKGFDKDLKCRKIQFAVGESYDHEGEVKACSSGWHACRYPLDVFNYYSPATSRFASVVQTGTVSENNDDSKVSSAKIEIKAELTLSGMIEAAIKFTMSQVDKSKGENNKKEKGHASNSLKQGAASNSGVGGAASNSGVGGAASNSGSQGAASNSGDYGAASNSGVRGAASNSGVGGAASNSGVGGASFTNSWNGNSQTTSKRSVAVATGYKEKAKASKGQWIVLAERDIEWNILSVKTAQAGVTKSVKADTFYQLVNGEFVEVD